MIDKRATDPGGDDGVVPTVFGPMAEVDVVSRRDETSNQLRRLVHRDVRSAVDLKSTGMMNNDDDDDDDGDDDNDDDDG